ncbi:hypothetical protein [Streptomyces sirii]|uniref:hypothetical protein n=1 Tax=Streptomyces sirii TaxID=3127701 RepID=UPI003D35F496
MQTQYGPEQRRLARAIGTRQGDALTRGDLQIHVGDRLDSAVAAGDLPHPHVQPAHHTPFNHS